MVKYEFSIRNSTILPADERHYDFDETTTFEQIVDWVQEHFGLRKNTFVLFLRSRKKWFLLKEGSKLNDYELSKERMRIDVKRKISLKEIDKLKKEIQKTRDHDMPFGVTNVDSLSPQETNNRLVESALEFFTQSLSAPEIASFLIPSRSGSNIGFDEKQELVLIGRQMIERQFRSLSSVSSVEQMSILMKLIHDILTRDIHSTKRDIFYMDVNSFEKQSVSDALIEDLSAMIQATRSSLNISASSKGIVVGRVSFREKGDFIDCSKMGAGKSIAPNINDIEELDSDAEFCLIIEKDAVFNRLAEDHFYDYIPSIIVTAKGQPDMATRQFLRKIDEELSIPILAIVDADPYGFEIMRVYSVGSKALSYESAHLAVPNIKWLGLLPSDLLPESGFDIPKSAFIKMTSRDTHRSKLMMEEEFVKRKQSWRDQLQVLVNLGYKAEIQALNARDPQFITNFYLPEKLQNGDYI